MTKNPIGWLRQRAALLLALLAGGCSGTDALNALAPSAGVAATTGIAYAAGPRQSLDVYAPTQPAPGAPVVVFFPGGGWEAGDTADYRWFGASLASRGAIVVLANYRLYPEVRFPTYMQDAALAVAWAHQHAGRFEAGGADGPVRGPFYVMGHSAGAQIAVLLALDPRYLAGVGVQPGRDLAGAIGLSGPYDFLPLRTAKLRDIFPESVRPASQAINFTNAAAPPLLLAHGCADTTVEFGNSLRLAARQRAAGGMVTLRAYPGTGHIMTIGAFAGALRFANPVMTDVLAFLKLAPPRSPVLETCEAERPA